eukprot:1887527-Lingulodinium_polyedra.AAC.1
MDPPRIVEVGTDGDVHWQNLHLLIAAAGLGPGKHCCQPAVRNLDAVREQSAVVVEPQRPPPNTDTLPPN